MALSAFLIRKNQPILIHDIQKTENKSGEIRTEVGGVKDYLSAVNKLDRELKYSYILKQFTRSGLILTCVAVPIYIYHRKS
jgi:hypothetical protein